MDRCQEMSQTTPTMTLVDAKATAHRGHGESVAAAREDTAGTSAGLVTVAAGNPAVDMVQD